MMTQSENTASVSEYEALIASYPLFCLLTPENIHALALVAREKYVDSGTHITEEGAVVDSVYLILSGTAEVMVKEGNGVKSVAKLGPGDAIGLAESGFFSPSGIRTATVIAETSLVLLTIDIEDFYHFLREPSVPYPGLKNVGEKILLMNSIRKIELFSHLSSHDLHLLATLVKKISLNANEIIFTENDEATNCFFILSGKVEITKNNMLIAELQTPSIFGIEDFTKHKKYQTTARTMTETKLLVLEEADVKRFLIKDKKTSKLTSFLKKLFRSD